MTLPDLTLTQDGAEWTAVLAGIVGVDTQTAVAFSAEGAAELVRLQAGAACIAAARAQGLTLGPLELVALELRLRQTCSLALDNLDPKPMPKVSGFGTDVSTFQGPAGDDVHPHMPLMTGERAIAEIVARRMLTPRGTLEYAPDAGVDARQLLGEGYTPGRLAEFRIQAQAEATADERVEGAELSLVFEELTGDLTLTVTITPADPNLRTFDLVLSVSKVGVKLEVRL